MKRLFLVVSCAVVLGGCAMTFPKPAAPWPPAARASAPVLTDANGVPIERIPFRAGVSSATVENMAREVGCVGGKGAGLMTPQGPIEVYRMICDSNQVFVARCEFRQCTASAPTPAGGYGVARRAAAADTRQGSAPGYRPQQGMSVPKLTVRWECGICSVDEKLVPLIVAAYEKEAAAKGYTVSNNESAVMTINQYLQRNSAMRAALGSLIGRDYLGTRTVFGGKTVAAFDDSVTASVGMASLAEAVGKKTLDGLIAPGR